MKRASQRGGKGGWGGAAGPGDYTPGLFAQLCACMHEIEIEDRKGEREGAGGCSLDLASFTQEA